MVKFNYVQEFKKKASDLVSIMTLSEKISQLRNHSKALKKYNIPEYNWWNECSHGVARAGLATVFPQSICMAATFSDEILYNIGDMISTEARAKHHEFVRNGIRGKYNGLTFWSPNINIVRDPRWGRGQETYGEDPYLTSILAVSYINGLQGQNEKYLKVAACAKHFAVHSGPEAERHSFNAIVSKKDLAETYLYAFEKAVKLAKVESIMTAYNRLNGEACAASKYLLQDILRGKWSFDGHVVSDCGSVKDIIFHHKITYNPLKGVSLALKSGLDLECGVFYSLLPIAIRLGYASIEDIDRALTRILTTRFKLGMFNNDCDYSKIPTSKIACEEHENYAIKVAEKSIVLFENKNNVLPLNAKEIASACILGANATNELAYLGNYYGTPSRFINCYDSIKQILGEKFSYERTIPLCGKIKDFEAYSKGLKIAENSEIVFIATGIDSSLEGEAGDAGAGKEGIVGNQGDRDSINLPKIQIDLITEVAKLNKKIIILNFSGSCINFSPIIDKVDAIMQCWYPGALGGEAIANILFGEVSPSGRTPITFYANDNDLPDFYDYSMSNRTYRYFTGKPLYPFGYGLSYTNFEYFNFQTNTNIINDDISISVDITNSGNYDADEVIQIYLKYPEGNLQQPKIKLISFKRIFIKKSKTKTIEFKLNKIDFYAIDINGDELLLNGKHSLSIGGGQPNYAKSLTLYFESC